MRPDGVLETEAAGESLWLLPERAAFWPRERTLLVADAHIGKDSAFRSAGLAVPAGPTTDDLRRLGELIERYAPARLVFLGDLVHDRRAREAAGEAFIEWRSRYATLDVVLIRGNHDRHAGELPPDLAVTLVEEPWLLPALEPGSLQGLALCHHPRPLRGWQVLAGHLHPAVSLGARARDRLRLPCFHFSGQVGVLPAFGGFTGMHPIRREAGDRVFAIADAVVYRV